MILLAGLMLLMGSQEPQRDSANQTQAQPDTRKGRVSGPTGYRATSNGPPGQPGASPNKGQGQEREPAGWRDPMVLVTLGLLAIAGGQLWMFSRQLDMMRTSLKDATKSANAAEKGVRLAKRSAERQLRAYLSVRPTLKKPTFKTKGILDLDMGVVIRNRGATPAYHLRVASGVCLLDPDFSTVPDLTDDPSVGILGPAAVSRAREKEVYMLTRQEYDLVAAKQKRLFFFGYVEYEDAFCKRWQQRYCHFLDLGGGREHIDFLLGPPDWNREALVGRQSTPK